MMTSPEEIRCIVDRLTCSSWTSSSCRTSSSSSSSIEICSGAEKAVACGATNAIGSTGVVRAAPALSCASPARVRDETGETALRGSEGKPMDSGEGIAVRERGRRAEEAGPAADGRVGRKVEGTRHGGTTGKEGIVDWLAWTRRSCSDGGRLQKRASVKTPRKGSGTMETGRIDAKLSSSLGKTARDDVGGAHVRRARAELARSAAEGAWDLLPSGTTAAAECTPRRER